MARDSDGPRAWERRANIRLHRVLAIQVEHAGQFQPTFAVDLSVSGFRAVSTFALPREAAVRVRLHLKDGPLVEGLARVIWVASLQLNLYQLGFEFEELKSREDFESLYRFIERERLTAEAIPAPTLELAKHLVLRDLTFREIDRLAVLAEISELLNSSYRLQELLDKAVKITVEATGAERGLLLLDRGGSELEVPAAHSMTASTSTHYSRSVVHQVMTTGKPLLSVDATRDERLARSGSLKVLGTRSILCVLLSSQNRSFGMIYLDSSIRAGAFTQVDLQLASVIAGMAAAAIERAEYFSQLLQNEKLAAVATMMAGIVHELRSPLASILGIGELLQEEHGGELAQGLLEETSRCLSLVRDLLQVTRKEVGPLGPVDLSQVVSSTLPAIRSEFERHRVELVVELPESVPLILGNSDQLRQVVLNLLSNALFEARSRAEGRVEARVLLQDGRLLLVVADNGSGIPCENLGRIFDPFFTTKPAGEGTGLGLSILQRIVAEHRGTIQAANRSGGGALFTVEFPVLFSEQEADRAC